MIVTRELHGLHSDRRGISVPVTMSAWLQPGLSRTHAGTVFSRSLRVGVYSEVDMKWLLLSLRREIATRRRA